MQACTDLWQIPGRAEKLDPSVISEFKIGPLLEKVLLARGLTERDRIASSLGSGLPCYDPFLMSDMDKAVQAIRAAVDNGTKITVFGDYDVDGITSTYILSDWLLRQGGDCSVYIPERQGEGYGMSEAALAKIAAKGTGLIITVDNGITAVEEAANAAALGMQMVITDHHTPGAVLPNCLAVVDPHRAGDLYPNKALAGVGVAFKLICALSGGESPELMRAYGPMLALGTVADVCAMTPENRRLLTEAEPYLASCENLGLKALAVKVNCSRPTLNDIGFRIAPKLNAAGRVDSPMNALSLLRATDEAEATKLADLLFDLNTKRQTMENAILTQAKKLIAAENPQQNRALILREDTWRLGVLGIVAARIADSYSIPVVLLSKEGDMLKGSARSGGDFDVFQALSKASEGIASCGGHRQAAGVRVPPENFDLFKKRFYEITASSIPEGGLSATLETDGAVEPEDITVENINQLDRLAPFGPDNSQPVFVLFDMVVSSIWAMGDGKHTGIVFEKGCRNITAVWFGCSPEKTGLREKCIADVAFVPEVNEYKGCRSPRATVKAVRLAVPRAEKQMEALQQGQSEWDPRCATTESYFTAPKRESCVAVWKALTETGGRFRIGELYADVRTRAAATLLDVLVCLQAFGETGLIASQQKAAEDNGWNRIIFLPKQNCKVSLGEAPVFKSFERM